MTSPSHLLQQQIEHVRRQLQEQEEWEQHELNGTGFSEEPSIGTEEVREEQPEGSHRAQLTEETYRPEVNEKVKVRGLRGEFRFVRFDRDKGGDYAVVIGGMKGHRLERCISVDRIVAPRARRGRRRVVTPTVTDVRLTGDGGN